MTSTLVDIHGKPLAASGMQQSANAYKGAEISRLTKDWMPQHRSGDDAIGEDWDLLTSRIRDLFRNDAVMTSCKRGLAKGVVGANGIQSFADVLDGQEADDDFNIESDDLFEEYCEEEIDAEGRMAWSGMQWLHFSETMETGEHLLLECWDPDPDRIIPICYQMLEAEQIDETKDWPAGKNQNLCVRGIEYDRNTRPLFYWLYDAHPYDNRRSGQDSKRIPANRVIHSYLPTRSSEHRGVTWFKTNIQSARDMDWYLGNELTAAALGALLTLIVKRQHGAGGGVSFEGGPNSTPGNTDAYGNNIVKLGRGIVADIGPQDSIEVAESKRPNRDAEPFIKLLLMLQGMGAGLSPLRLTGDYSQASYTSARGAHLDDQAFFQVLQNWASRSFVKPIRKRFTQYAAAFGRFRTLGAKQYRANKRIYNRMVVQPPGREQLDPEKETGAAKDRIRGNLSTHQAECGLRGLNWRRVAIQRKREKAFFAEHGVEPDLDQSAAYLARQQSKKQKQEEEAISAD